MARTAPLDLYADAVRDLDGLLTPHGAGVRHDEGGLALEVSGHPDTALEVVALSYAQPGRVAELIQEASNERALHVLVADAIPQAARERLDKAGWGWLDRRGVLVIRGPLHVYKTIDSVERVRAQHVDRPVRGRSGITTAALLLMRPKDPPGVREMARECGMAPSTISVALSRLRAASLVREDGGPLYPELFWELADAWKPQRRPFAEPPGPDDPAAAFLLSFGLESEADQGWVVGGTVAAAAWGAPMIATADYPPDFYLPSPGALRNAEPRYGWSPWEERACSAAVALTPLTTGPSRHNGRRYGGWPVVHPLFAALDLAQDKARGVEALEEWTPPPPLERVW